MYSKVLTRLSKKSDDKLFDELTYAGAFAEFKEVLNKKAYDLGYNDCNNDWDSFVLLDFSFEKYDPSKPSGICYFPKGMKHHYYNGEYINAFVFGIIVTLKSIDCFFSKENTEVKEKLLLIKSLIIKFISKRADYEHLE